MIGGGAKGDLEEPIVALATPRGAGPRAILRLTGRHVARLVKSVIPDFEPDPLRSRQIARVGIRLSDAASPLPADVFFFRAPATYTGQDLVEIHTLSSWPLVEATMAALLSAGARGARPGEFTMRGFLAGKFDLTRAEAVHAVIEASGPDQLTVALAQLAGNVARPLDEARDDLLNLLADVEAGLDFSDEDISFVEAEQLLLRIAKALARVTLIGKQVRDRGVSGVGYRVVLAGPPNVGKSSLFNALLGRDSALVSGTAGTTRDVLEAEIRLADVTVRLIDTAGLGEPTGAIDAAAQALGRDSLAGADLVLWCEEAGARVSQDEIPDRNRLRVATKSDRGSAPAGAIAVSAHLGHGIDELRSLLVEKARAHQSDPLAPSLSRCRHHVDACLAALRRAHAIALESQPVELLALELRLALDELGAIVGALHTDDLLDRIFSRFCIGK